MPTQLPFGLALQRLDVGDQQNALQQVVDAAAHLRRDRHAHHVAAVFFDQHAVIGQLLLDASGLALGLSILFSATDRHLGRLDMGDGFLGLRHHAVIGGHHQHGDVGDLAPRARMAVNASWPGVSRKVILRPLTFDLVGADVLRDAAGLALDHARVSRMASSKVVLP